MSSVSGEKFGATVRRDREKMEIGLREMAKKIGVSATYLSKIERDEFPPPAEDKVLAIANVLRHKPDAPDHGSALVSPTEGACCPPNVSGTPSKPSAA